MARNSYMAEYPETGIIILGNTGAGKSYLCNVLFGENKFETGFQPDAVTTQTERQSFTYYRRKFFIFNVPGLVEANAKLIEQNKREINKAFEMCEKSIIIFVWRETGGRAQSEDIIAFNALNSACEFPSKSLMFVVNNVPSNRAHDYDAKFIVLLSKQLRSIRVSFENTIFVENMRPADQGRIETNRQALWLCLFQMKPFIHKKQIEILLQVDQINELKANLKRQQEEAERDKEKLRLEIDQMLQKNSITKDDADNKIQRLKSGLNQLKIKYFSGKLGKIFKMFIIIGALSFLVRLIWVFYDNRLAPVVAPDCSLNDMLDCKEGSISPM